MLQFLLRIFLSLAGVAVVTWAGFGLVSLNATTIGFAYLLLVLIAATLWGFAEAAAASVAATLTFNFFFLPPIGRFTIADPQNWVALFSFLTTALIASRLSAEARRRTLDALARQQDLERLYSFSRAILLIGGGEPFPKQLVRKLVESFDIGAVVLFERRTERFYRDGPLDFDGLDGQLRDSALLGTSFSDPQHNRVITAVRLGAEPIAGLALQAPEMPDAVLQGISNLVAIGLERARAQELAADMEASQRSEKLRRSLLDAMAHELKTPLTSVMAATTALLADPDLAPRRRDLVRVADEEAKHLDELITDTVDMGRLDAANIHLETEDADIGEVVQEVVQSMRNQIDSRPVHVTCEPAAAIAVDRRLIKLAIKQLLDNALKYSPSGTPVDIEVHNGGGVGVEITDHGEGIPEEEQTRIFERLYRSPAVRDQTLGSGLGLSIALNIVRAHRGELTVNSEPGRTTFRLSLPAGPKGNPA